MAKKVGNEVLTKKDYKKQVSKFCKHVRRKLRKK